MPICFELKPGTAEDFSGYVEGMKVKKAVDLLYHKERGFELENFFTNLKEKVGEKKEKKVSPFRKKVEKDTEKKTSEYAKVNILVSQKKNQKEVERRGDSLWIVEEKTSSISHLVGWIADKDEKSDELVHMRVKAGSILKSLGGWLVLNYNSQVDKVLSK